MERVLNQLQVPHTKKWKSNKKATKWQGKWKDLCTLTTTNPRVKLQNNKNYKSEHNGSTWSDLAFNEEYFQFYNPSDFDSLSLSS